MSIDPQELAKQELAKNLVPTPDDIAEMLSPIAMLYYFEQLGWATIKTWTGHLMEHAKDPAEITDDLSQTLQGIMEVVGALDEVAARIGLIPAEAVTGAPK